jgi:glycosyltransferase involved in cell wall biosynthesis
MPAVSVIIAAKNAAPFLETSVGSALRQTFRDVEVVVVDDGSTDATLQVLARLAAGDSRVRFFSQINQGVSAARNRAMAEARGDYYLSLDADDELAPRCVELLMDGVRRTGAQWAASAVVRRAETGEQILNPPPPSEDLLETLFFRQFPYRAYFYSRQAIDKTGGFDVSFAVCEDWDLWARLAKAGLPFFYVPEPLYVYRIQASSLTKGDDFIKNLNAVERVYDRHCIPCFDSRPAVRHAYAKSMYLLSGEFRKRGAGLMPVARTFWKSLRADYTVAARAALARALN